MSEALALVDSPIGFELEHLSPVIGTVVHGIDLRVIPNEEVATSSFGITRKSIP